jgi:hypothetical protein
LFAVAALLKKALFQRGKQAIEQVVRLVDQANLGIGKGFGIRLFKELLVGRGLGGLGFGI